MSVVAVSLKKKKLRSYGFAAVARLKYDYQPRAPRPRTEGAVPDRFLSRASGGGFYFFFQADDGIRDFHVPGVQTCALPISAGHRRRDRLAPRQRAGRRGLLAPCRA